LPLLVQHLPESLLPLPPNSLLLVLMEEYLPYQPGDPEVS